MGRILRDDGNGNSAMSSEFEGRRLSGAAANTNEVPGSAKCPSLLSVVVKLSFTVVRPRLNNQNHKIFLPTLFLQSYVSDLGWHTQI